MNTPTITNTIPDQTFGKYTARVVRAKVGSARGILAMGGRFGAGQVIPLDLVPHLVDRKDQWMKKVLVRCGDCKVRIPAGTLECDMCPTCYEKAGEENAEQDAR
jgi:hypothetical protein